MLREDIDSGVGFDQPPSCAMYDWHLRALRNESSKKWEHRICFIKITNDGSCHNFMWMLDWSCGSLSLHQNDFWEALVEIIFFPHPPSLVLFPHLRRCPPNVLVIRCSEPSPWIILLGLCPSNLNWTYWTGVAWGIRLLAKLIGEWIAWIWRCIWVQDPYTHLSYTHSHKLSS